MSWGWSWTMGLDRYLQGSVASLLEIPWRLVHQPTAAFSRRRKDGPNSSRSCRPMSNSELHAQDNILQKLQKQSLYNPIPPEQAKGGGILPSLQLRRFLFSISYLTRKDD
ncbi:hypothetical protein CDAR_12351 [Caerostris darwini]|uniref:Uncharacterized protein n=1 Tax=Caerostris darwini TaxID=1538125 RepID=A0AAV4V2M3_9ARAC|nr:hypothetical protein CDAR_12351 [Caerostris darwini]